MSDAFQPLDLDALFALDLPEPDWVVERLFPLGSAALLTAREKAGKGLLTIDLCASVAAGEPFLDRAVLEGPAIYCAAEENLRDVRARIAARLGDRRDLPLYVLPLDGFTEDRLKLTDAASMDRLAVMIAERQPLLVVLDVLRELHDGQEDSSDDMAPILRPVRQLAHQTNTAIVVNHHMNRSGTFRGSTAIRSAFDVELAFTRHDDANDDGLRGALRIEGRFGPRHTVTIAFGDGNRWQTTELSLTVGEANLRDRILATLTERDAWLDSDDLTCALPPTAKKTIQNKLAEMMQEDPKPFAVRASGEKGKPRQYHALTQRLFATTGDDTGTVPSFPVPLCAGEGRNGLWSRPKGSGNGGNDARERSGVRLCVHCAEPFTGAGVLYCPRHRAATAAEVAS